ncbi:hypothetical protein GQ600_8070 [Phytophthora cactorum]|nr:hypothetical protein GQ600_8070 [Phytophthora cactorum]
MILKRQTKLSHPVGWRGALPSGRDGPGVTSSRSARRTSSSDIRCRRSKIVRLKAMIKNGIDSFHTRRTPTRPKHALSSDDIDFFFSACIEWKLEDDFPCSHRRPRQYFVKPFLTWKTLWRRFSQKPPRVIVG